ncbi:hypothetical protein BH09PAT1_BH09PAT1_1230 [soil metagenome]
MEELTGHQKSAKAEARDSHGHFVHSPEASSSTSAPTIPASGGHRSQLLDKILPTHLEIDHKVSQDDLVDVHIGNPLRKITAILEEIKAQKAFSFTLKGSLGIAGVILTLSVFGFFGGSKMLCDKGTQTLSGTVKQLSVVTTPPQIPLLTSAINSFNYIVFHKDWPTGEKRYILVNLRNASTIFLNGSLADISPFTNSVVYATGQYGSCSRTLKVKEPHAIEDLH